MTDLDERISALRKQAGRDGDAELWSVLTDVIQERERASTEGAIMREALRKIAEEHDADGSMRFEAQAALDSVSGRHNGN